MVVERLDHRPAEEQAHRRAEQRAEHRDDHRLPPDHRANLPALHAHRAEEPDLSGPLVDRQGEGVHDADEGDEDGQEQQRADQPEELVDLVRLALSELGLVLELNVRERLGHPRRSGLRLRLGGPGCGLGQDDDVELFDEVLLIGGQ